MLKNLATTAITLACLSTAVQADNYCPSGLTLDNVNTLLKTGSIEIKQGDLIANWKLILDGNVTDKRYGLLQGGHFDPDVQITVSEGALENSNLCRYDVIMSPKSLVATVRTIGRFRITQEVVQQKK